MPPIHSFALFILFVCLFFVWILNDNIILGHATIFRENKRNRIVRDFSGTRDFCPRFGILGDNDAAAFRSVRSVSAARKCRSGTFSSPDVCVYHTSFHTMELPETIRKPLEYISRNVLFDQDGPFTEDNDTFMPQGKETRNAANKLALMLTQLARVGLSCQPPG